VLALGLSFAIASSLCWSALDALRKKLTATASPLWVAAWISLLQIPIFALALFGQGLAFGPDYFLPGFLAALFGGAGALLFLYAVRAAPLSLAIPCLSLTPVISTLGAWAFVGERPTLFHWMGGALVVLCAVGLYRSAADRESDSTTRAGILLMIVAAACWAMSAAADKWSIQESNVSTHALIQSMVGALVFFGVWGWGKKREAFWPRGNAKLLVVTALFFAAAFAFQLFALERIWVGSVEAPKRAIGVVGAIFLGHRVFNEVPTFKKLLWVGGMTAGALVMILGEWVPSTAG
jgi:drug/metabolite transporter (DMT)-like permease